MFSQPGNTHTNTYTHIHQSGSTAWQINHTSTQCERGSYHSQDGIEEDVQLYYGGAGVVQNGPGQFKHTVICGQVQVVQDFLVTAHFLRGRPSYCTLKLSERVFFLYRHLYN